MRRGPDSGPLKPPQHGRYSERTRNPATLSGWRLVLFADLRVWKIAFAVNHARVTLMQRSF